VFSSIQHQSPQSTERINFAPRRLILTLRQIFASLKYHSTRGYVSFDFSCTLTFGWNFQWKSLLTELSSPIASTKHGKKMIESVKYIEIMCSFQ